jgi:hypothetical protein
MAAAAARLLELKILSLHDDWYYQRNLRIALNGQGLLFLDNFASLEDKDIE